MPTPDDRDQAQPARQGPTPETSSQLVELYQRRLFGLTLMMLRDPSEAVEVTQDAFVRAFTHLDLYDERRPFYPWIAIITQALSKIVGESPGLGRAVRSLELIRVNLRGVRVTETNTQKANKYV